MEEKGYWYQGNCLDMFEDMDSDSIDMILTDPPWGTTSLELDKKGRPPETVWKECKRVLKPNGWLFTFGQLPLFMEISKTGFVDAFTYVWIKPKGPVNLRHKFKPSVQHEILHAFHLGGVAEERFFDEDALRTYGHRNYFRRRKNASNSKWSADHAVRKASNSVTRVSDGSRSPTTILRYNNKPCMDPNERTDHPTQKPVAMLVYLIRGYCPPNGIVLDPFAGSGSTFCAAEIAGRRWTGAEMDQKWSSTIEEQLGNIKVSPVEHSTTQAHLF